jgi:hypothetical protein
MNAYKLSEQTTRRDPVTTEPMTSHYVVRDTDSGYLVTSADLTTKAHKKDSVQDDEQTGLVWIAFRDALGPVRLGLSPSDAILWATDILAAAQATKDICKARLVASRKRDKVAE